MVVKRLKEKRKHDDDSDRMFRESPWHITNFIRELDKFAQPIPAFNIKGRDEVKTVAGGFLTMATIVLTLGYFVIKLQDLRTGSDKTINYNKVNSYYGEE